MTKPLPPAFESLMIKYRTNIERTILLITLAPLPVVWFYWPLFDEYALAVRQTRMNDPNANFKRGALDRTQVVEKAPTTPSPSKSIAYSSEDD